VTDIPPPPSRTSTQTGVWRRVGTRAIELLLGGLFVAAYLVPAVVVWRIGDIDDTVGLGLLVALAGVLPLPLCWVVACMAWLLVKT
jgi:hypothetical protein